MSPSLALARPGYDNHGKVVTFVCAASCPCVVLRARASEDLKVQLGILTRARVSETRGYQQCITAASTLLVTVSAYWSLWLLKADCLNARINNWVSTSHFEDWLCWFPGCVSGLEMDAGSSLLSAGPISSPDPQSGTSHISPSSHQDTHTQPRISQISAAGWSLVTGHWPLIGH